MDLILDGIRQALRLMVSLDSEVFAVTLLSLKVSCFATLISLILGIPAGTLLALASFPGRRLVVSLVNTGMGLPPVVVGLFVTIFLWRNGPLGFLEILYTPSAMVLAQAVIATPIVAGITIASIQNLPANLKLQVLALGATRVQMVWILVREARLPLLAAVMAGFGGVISEVGASLMVGGNIKGQTRVLTTATVMETGKGNFDVAIALSLILLLLAFGVNYLLTVIQQRERPQMNILLEAENLRIRRGGVQVLDIPSFSVAAEEKVAVVGPNGSGKSSLLLGLACLLRRESGTITFCGEPVIENLETAYRRKIAMVFQEPLLFDTTVLDNVAEGLRIRGKGRTEARDIARDSLELFKVGHLTGRSAHKLSGGEAQRVSLARAFAVRPELLLMDEPFSSLDLPTRIVLAEDLGRILHESGTAAIIATHDRIEAFHIVERLVVMDGGKIIQEGTPKAVMAEPVNAFVAAFRRTTSTM